jgi:hypothetical protein
VVVAVLVPPEYAVPVTVPQEPGRMVVLAWCRTFREVQSHTQVVAGEHRAAKPLVLALVLLFQDWEGAGVAATAATSGLLGLMA